MPTFQQFLLNYQNAECLEHPKFSNVFPEGVERADFVLFEGAAICEVKQIEAVDFPARVQKLIGRKPENFKRDAYNTINHNLSKANDQIISTKKALGLSDAVGIIVLDNQILENNSIVTALDAAQRKMIGGLASVDAVLCLDMINGFTRPTGEKITVSQCLIRDSAASQRAAEICEKVMSGYCTMIGRPIEPLTILGSSHEWVFDKEKRFVRYKAEIKSKG